MNSYLKRYPLRILVVEDGASARNDLVRFLKGPSCFPGAEIADFPDRVQTMEAIDRAPPFDCAILDLKIPDREGEAPYSSSDVAIRFLDRHLIADRDPKEIWIIHWTGFPEDAEIRKFRDYLGERGVPHRVVAKANGDAAGQIRAYLECALVEKALGRNLDDPFFAHEMGGETWSLAIRNTRRPQPPMNLVGLSALLADSWGALSPHRRSQALHAFAGSEMEIIDHGETAELKYEETQKAAERWFETQARRETQHP